MTGAIAWFARNSVAANLLMLSVVAAGLLTLPRIKQEVFPEVDTGVITVSVPYPGAAPEEVEEGIVIRIEEQIQSVEGIDRITSTSTEGVGVVTAKLSESTDPRRALDDIRSQVDAIDSFPEKAEKPIVAELSMRQQVISVAVSGRAEERTLKVLGQRVRDEIAALPGITHVELAADRAYEISIEVSEGALRRHGLTFDDVVAAVRRSSLDLSGGSIKTRGGEILLRAKGQAYRGEEFERIVLLPRRDGSRLLLGDVASVVDGFADSDRFARFDGAPAVLVQVFRVADQSALDVAAAVASYLESARQRMPAGVKLTTWQDDTILLESRRNTLLRNGRDGFALVIVVLALFLKLRVALWVALGVPISLLGALWLMPFFDVSINLLSLFAFIVVLGILVDDAIVTGENVHTHQERDPDRLRAAIRGTQEIATPVTFGVLTTMAAFAPMMTMPGSMGRIGYAIPIVVISALFFSLVESKLVLPSHLAHEAGRLSGFFANPLSRGWARAQEGFSSQLGRFVEIRYRPFLERCLEWRYLTAALALVIFAVTAVWVATGRLRFTFFPQIEGDNVVALVTMPEGTSSEVTAEVVAVLAAGAEAVRRELAGPDGASPFRHVLTTVGEQPFADRQHGNPADGGNAASGAHRGEVNIELSPSDERSTTSTEVARRWREISGSIPGAVELTFTSSLFSTGEPIFVELRGREMEELRASANALKAALANYPGVYDIADSFREGEQELRLGVRPSAEALGLSLHDLARQVRQAFYGDEAQRIQRGRDEVKVMVRYPAARRRSLADVENMRIRLPDGTALPFASVARVESSRGFSTIRRAGRQRVIDVTAEVDLNEGNANEILADLQSTTLPQILAEHDGVIYTLQGEQREQIDTLENVRRGFTLSMIAIFALLAIPLRSYIQPLIIMSAIPFGFVGAAFGHIVTGRDFCMLSIIGVMACAGVVVNDSLVLVNYVNERRREGVSTRQAIEIAGLARFRPILLTSLTTFVGLTPVMLERSIQAQFLIPMAVSLAFGVLLATFVTLLLVPVNYMIVEDLRALPGRWLSRGLQEEGEATAA